MQRYTIGLIAILIFLGGSIEAQVPYCGSNSIYLALAQRQYQAVLSALSGVIFKDFGGNFKFAPRADGGGDGGGDGGDGGGTGGSGGGDGGGSGDGGASDGGGDSGSNGGDASGNGDAPSGETGTVGDPGNEGDPGNSDAVTSDPSAVSVETTDPADLNAAISPTAPTATLDVAQTAPNFGPGSPGSGVTKIFARRAPGGTPRGGVGSDVGINAVIVSGAPTPWEAIGKIGKVRYVFVTGGIIALGETALARPFLSTSGGAADNPPAWLNFKPDYRYLNGSVFPPIVPNVIDIRTISYTEKAIENPEN